MIKHVAFFLLVAAVFTSALEIVLHRHQNRQLFLAWQELQTQQSDLDREWGQLLLEQGTWGTHGRIEDIARNQLDMTLPDVSEIFRVKS
jgi:cell division protein FtsL